ncbi:MAG: metal-dependent hydrolase [Janthinobacterium lividum]
MEPVTHVLTGACLARAGCNRRAAYATVAMAIAAEFPDIDTMWSVRGPVAGFEHHRGITHTFAGIPFEGGLLLLCFYGFHHFRSKKDFSQSKPASIPGTSIVPANWGLLYCFLLLALLSHILLDYTNNYGIRPFSPFSPHWYAGSFVFIFDPLLFAMLVAGLSLPALFEMIGREIGAKRNSFRGRGWARTALLCVLILWTLRWFEHSRAVVLAQTQTLRAPGEVLTGTRSESPYLAEGNMPDTSQSDPEPHREVLSAQRSLASPDPLSIFRWYTATDFGPVEQIGVADVRIGSISPGETFTKPQMNPNLLLAEHSRLGRAYMNWSPMPIISSSPGSPDNANLDAPDRELLTITFADPRFMGDTPLAHLQGHTPLTGQVVLKAQGKVVAAGMDGRFGQ